MNAASNAAQAAGPPQPLTILGVESSCDDSAAAVIRRHPDGRVDILSDIVWRQNDEHAAYGGVVPEIAARAHAERLDAVVTDAMRAAGLDYDALDAVAATAGPGLIGGVMVGLMTAKGVAAARGLPLIAVNHLEAHALSPRLTERLDFPYLALLVSGGHTQLALAEDVGRYQRLGATIDDAAGEAFDKAAKLMGLGNPGGPAIEQLARNGDPARFKLPRPLFGAPHCDFSFSGLKTAVLRAWNELPAPSEQDRADMAASFQLAVADILSDRARRAMKRAAEAGARVLAVVGGVASNATLRSALSAAAAEEGFTLIAPPPKWCTDNAAMVALAGAERFARGMSDALDVAARPRWPLDQDAARAAPASGGGRKGPKA